MTNVPANAAQPTSSISIQIWVAGTDIAQALSRRQAADEWMSHRFTEDPVGGGFGRFFYDLWREQTGLDPLALEGECIADSEYHLGVQDVSPNDLAALSRLISKDLKDALGFPVAVQVEVIPIDEEGRPDCGSENVPDPGTSMSALITDREHATILAALRYVARHGGFNDSIEADMAASGK